MRDKKDLQTLEDWFDVQNPFDEDEQRLKSLSSGLIGDGAINCDKAEEIGRKIQETLDGVKMEEASIKRKNCKICKILKIKVQNFENLLPTTKIKDKASILAQPSCSTVLLL